MEALLRERNVTRAALRPNLGRPALSARLNRLRPVFADPLFVPLRHSAVCSINASHQ
ncbi:LysR family transcriptional regulator [Bradyrhizobium cytisi]|uniref:LysR family transcriptional regulator n=1 Tax=Bradyrhizobium cytisi TaxID=515489 RepID=UPI0024BF9B0B|nr:LysR family transcriptional regulator [Bradyrhizobium cytisi]